MSQDPEVVKRYTEAQHAFEELFGGRIQDIPLNQRSRESVISLPPEGKQLEIILEVISARKAYCADLESNGFVAPGGFHQETENIEYFLKNLGT